MRPAWQRVTATAATLASALITGYLLVLLLGAVQIVRHDGYFHLAWLPMTLVALLALVGGAYLGMGVGRALPSALTPPILAIAVLVLGAALAQGGDRDVQTGFESAPARLFLLSPGLAGVHNPWLVLTERVDLGQAAWLLGLTGTGLVLAAAAHWRARLLAVLPVAAGLVIALALFPASGLRAYATDAAAARQVCSGNVCVTRLHQSQLAKISEPGRSALRRLSTLPGAPTRVEESTYTLTYLSPPRPRSAAVVAIWFDDAPFRDAPGEELERGLLAGAGTPSCFNTSTAWEKEGLRESAARTVAAAWFLGDLKSLYQSSLGDDFATLAAPAWETLRALPRGEQQARMVALRSAALSCQGDLLDILTRGVGAGR